MVNTWLIVWFIHFPSELCRYVWSSWAEEARVVVVTDITKKNESILA